MNFIQLTLLNGIPIFINFNLVITFVRYDGCDFTSIFYDSENNDRVKETPYEIFEKLKNS